MREKQGIREKMAKNNREKERENNIERMGRAKNKSGETVKECERNRKRMRGIQLLNENIT